MKTSSVEKKIPRPFRRLILFISILSLYKDFLSYFELCLLYLISRTSRTSLFLYILHETEIFCLEIFIAEIVLCLIAEQFILLLVLLMNAINFQCSFERLIYVFSSNQFWDKISNILQFQIFLCFVANNCCFEILEKRALKKDFFLIRSWNLINKKDVSKTFLIVGKKKFVHRKLLDNFLTTTDLI